MPRKPLDLISLSSLPNTNVARADAADTIFFALANEKAHYNRKHLSLFIKVSDLAILRLHKGYSILFLARVTKKLTQQYVGPFQIKKRIKRLTYSLKIPNDWQIYPVFLVAQLEPASEPSNDPFRRSCPYYPPAVFVDNDTDSFKSFKINCLLNKQIIKKGKGLTVKYLVHWTGYDLE